MTDTQRASADDAFARGLEMMDRVYGEGFSRTVPRTSDPLGNEVVAHVFGDVWSRPGLSIRDRRLLVIGATAALGRADLLEVQVRGALANNELSEEELREIPLQLMYYLGIGNAGLISGAISRATVGEAPTQPKD
jgi:4-carboxymuconolactone decarboxylase